MSLEKWVEISQSDLAYLFRYISCQSLALAALGRFEVCPACCESVFVPALQSVAHCTFCGLWFDVDVLQKDGSV